MTTISTINVKSLAAAAGDIGNAGLLPYGEKWGSTAVQPLTLTYSFPTAPLSYYASNSPETAGFQAFASEWQTLAKNAMTMVESFTNLKFTQTTGSSDLTFARSSQLPSSVAGWAYQPKADNDPKSGDVWIRTSVATNTFGQHVVMHELGHALGLQHTFDANLTGIQNTEQYSVMAYDHSPWGAIYPQSYMLYDIAALQLLYGANMTYHTGNDVYTLNGTSAFTIWDAGGTDTLDASATSQNAILNLNAGTYSSVGGLKENVAVAYKVQMENANGGSGHDSLIGNAANNNLVGNLGNDTLDGGAGNDTLNGGSGIDTASYASATAGVNVTLTLSTQNTLGAGTDTFISIENLIGSAFNDTLTGDTGNNTIEGGNGNDVLNGGGGSDTLSYASARGVTVNLGLTTAQNTGSAGTDTITNFEHLIGSAYGDKLTAGSSNGTIDGGAGNDTLTGSTSNSTLLGGLGNDTLISGTGNERLDGGDGLDTASYALATAAVSVNLGISGAQATGSRGTDTLISIENLIGSNYNDTLTGSAANNVIDGGKGNDVLDGGAGIDTLSYAVATAAVNVNLGLTSAQNTGAAGIDTILNFENLLGSNYNDTLTGSAANNFIDGGRGNDRLDGGAGIDTLSYAASGGAVTASLSIATAQNTGWSGIDTILNFENLTGSNYNDTLEGNSANNVLDGGLGNDTLSYANASAAVKVSLALTTAQATGGSGTDTITNFENLTGSNYNDNLTGTTANNILDGGQGNDLLDGGSGNDKLLGGLGNDTLIGGLGNDTIDGGAGNDVISGSAGNDSLIGGDGIDTLSFASATQAVYASLQQSFVNGVSEGTDLISGFENLTGSAFSDNLYGDSGNNIITGGGGSDGLTGGLGADTFVFDTTNFTAQDTIYDFSLVQGDKLDVGGLLSGYSAAKDISDYLIFQTVIFGIEEEDSSTKVNFSIDRDGLGTTYHAQLVGEFMNLSSLDAQNLLNTGHLILV